MQFHSLHVLVTCETQNFNDSCHFFWIFLFFVQSLHRGLSQKISTDSFLMLQPSPVGAANPGDAAPQAKTFSEAMEVFGAGAYPQYVRWILQISTKYQQITKWIHMNTVNSERSSFVCSRPDAQIPSPPMKLSGFHWSFGQRRCVGTQPRLSGEDSVLAWTGWAKPGGMCRTNLNVWWKWRTTWCLQQKVEFCVAHP